MVLGRAFPGYRGIILSLNINLNHPRRRLGRRPAGKLPPSVLGVKFLRRTPKLKPPSICILLGRPGARGRALGYQCRSCVETVTGSVQGILSISNVR